MALYRVTEDWQDLALRAQVRRSAQSVAANIVEGAGAASAAQFARYLGIALASACEVECHLRFAYDIGALRADANVLRGEAVEIKRILIALLRALRARASSTSRAPA